MPLNKSDIHRPQDEKQKTGIDFRDWRNKKTNKRPATKWICPNCAVVLPNGVKVKVHKEQCKAAS